MGSNSYGLPVKAGLHQTFLSDFPADTVSRGARIGRVNTIVSPIREANLCLRRSQFDWQSAAILKHCTRRDLTSKLKPGMAWVKI